MTNSPRTSARHGSGLTVGLLIVCSLVTMLGFAAVCASVIWEMRESDTRMTQRSLENVAASIEADVSRNIEMFDLSLRAVVANIQIPEAKTLNRELQHLILFDHSATARHLGALQVFDAQGRLTLDASTFDPPAQSAANEAFFQAHRDSPSVGLFISSPIVYRGTESIIFSRRIFGPDSSFQGVVAGAISMAYFNDLFGSLKLMDGDTISVLRRDGVVIARVPFNREVVGKNFSQMPVVKMALNEPEGHSSQVAPHDGVERLYVWRNNASPVVVLVGRAWNEIHTAWRDQTVRLIGSLIALIVYALALTFYLVSEIHRRAKAEQQLGVIATTDALTGLRNRRKFDEAAVFEWGRADADGSQLSLLLIDVDHFKMYNDTFGHQGGDDALIDVARCIAMAARREGDLAVRYGGEEFALLLPRTPTLDAYAIAESIRKSVAESRDNAPVTVSIGIASLTPDKRVSLVSLIQKADTALYAAKRNGRNRSEIAVDAKMALVA